MDSANHFEVGVTVDGKIVVGKLTKLVGRYGLLKADAWLLAAWLTVLADPDGTEVAKLIDEIKKS